jgi:copper chaperone CopZ
MARVRLTVTGMTCGHCRKKVEDALNGVDGVFGVYVDQEGGEAEVDFDDARTGTDALLKAVEASGYGATVPS